MTIYPPREIVMGKKYLYLWQKFVRILVKIFFCQEDTYGRMGSQNPTEIPSCHRILSLLRHDKWVPLVCRTRRPPRPARGVSVWALGVAVAP